MTDLRTTHSSTPAPTTQSSDASQHELQSLGMNHPKWQDALKDAAATGSLSVSGVVRDGQLLSFTDPSGAGLTVLTVEPFGVFAHFHGAPEISAHVEMLTDTIGLIDIIQDSPELQRANESAPVLATLTATVEQGPLIIDEPPMEYQHIELTALATSTTVSSNRPDGWHPVLVSPTAQDLTHGAGGQQPQQGAQISVAIESVEKRTNSLTGEDFWYAQTIVPFSFAITLPGDLPEPHPGDIITGEVVFTANIVAPNDGCSGSGCGSGQCGCGGH